MNTLEKLRAAREEVERLMEDGSNPERLLLTLSLLPEVAGILDDALVRVESLSFFTERPDVGLRRVLELVDAILRTEK